jgi:polyphosphate kinase
VPDETSASIRPDSPSDFFNRELSWLGFARRVLSLVEDKTLPLLERVKFAGIMGMLHDEFFMKRMSGLKRQIKKGTRKLSLDGRQPQEEFAACREELLLQSRINLRVIQEELRPALASEKIPLLDYSALDAAQKEQLRDYFKLSVQPILTPLAVDPEHPFPFISNIGLNLTVLLPGEDDGSQRFIRIKIPDNRPRWVPLPQGTGCVPMEQVIAANLDLMFPATPPAEIYRFRVTRGAEGEEDQAADLGEDDESLEPGSIIRLVSNDLKARRFAGVVRLEVDSAMPADLVKWLSLQLHVGEEDVYPMGDLLGTSDLLKLDAANRPDLRYPAHDAATHPRLKDLDPSDRGAIFEEIARGDLLLHHPYHSFDTSVVRFLESAAHDPAVLAIKLTIYRTSADSPIVRALAEAARRGKQVAVVVEITARFDEAPNIAWGQYLENEGVHVAYGIEQLKTHVKLALVVREEQGRVRRYAHVGSGNYHTGTARIYEDVGLLTCHPEICEDVAAVFNELTGATRWGGYKWMLVAPAAMRKRFAEMIRREAEHARAGRPSGIHAKLNQLQDPDTIRELYAAAQAGVPIVLNVRGLCCLRPGVPGLSESIRVLSVVGRFLEHSRVYRFENGGSPEYYLGSADWMKRNLESRVETIVPILDASVKHELAWILDVYNRDNDSAWDCAPDGSYVRRTPSPGEERRAAQEIFILEAKGETAPPAGPESKTAGTPPAAASRSGRASARGGRLRRRPRTRRTLEA